MDHQSQNEQFGMERGVIQAVSDDVVSFNNEIHPPALPQATHEELFNFHVEEEDVFFYERLTEALRIGAQSPPSNLLDAEQDMVAVATDEANNEQASFYSQAPPQANYDDISRRLSREEMDAFAGDILGPNNLFGFDQDMRVNNGQTPFLSQAYPQLPSVPQPSEHMDVDRAPVPVPAAQNIDPRLMESTSPGPAPISNNGNGNGNDEGSNNNNFEGYNNNNEGHNNGDADALMMDHEGQAPVAQAPAFAGAGHPSPAPPQPLIVPKTLKPKTAGNRVEKQAATKRKVGKKACSGCRKSKLRCEPAPGGTTCLECLERSRPCDMGRTTDDRTRETNWDKLLRTIEGYKRYLGDLLILIYSIKTAMDQGKLNDKMSMIRSELSNGLTRISMLVYILTNQQLTPEDEQNAQACVRLDALAGLQLDLQGIENNLADMRKTVRKCVGKTKDCVKTLGRYLHVLMDDEDHVGDAEISLRTIKESRTPFSQIDTDMKVQFSYIADNSDLVTSLVGHVDRLKAA
ncbi:hypothetical protein K4K61_000301 [Colletotrichum sp. SAR11_59]|nr:hypothetical protein K4K61_000301 [Colletotrichum sp. SAR11_59]